MIRTPRGRSTKRPLPFLSCLVGAALILPSDDAPPSRALLLELTSSARLAGTTGSLRAARMVARELAAAGFEVEVDEREVVLSLPRRLELGLYEDANAGAPFHERHERFDPDAIPAGDIPPFNAWSASGEIRGEVVDAGRGLRADFERLVDARVDLRGKVALCRYGGSYRGVKVDLATQYGCAGVLLFSDPADDGATQGDVWPKGPWKPDWAVQRGSISPMGRAPGDPSTPGFASPAPNTPLDAGRTRLAGADLDARLPTIPCLPIPASEASLVIERLAIRRVKAETGERESVRIGPGPVEARLVVDAPRDVRTIRNVIGRLAGTRGGVVIAGNHRDAWVRGAHDAGGGTVALLRAAQHLGARARGGWRPANTIAFAFWDAEESGLIGSTEWGEAEAGRLAERCVAYVNADALVSGTRFGASGTPGLEAVLARALARVDDPTGDGTLLDQWLASADGNPRLGLPGSGSDFAVFLHHLSVPVLDLGFRGNRGGQYHTAFDDFLVVERFLDPGFVGHETAGTFVAELMAELAALGELGFDDARAASEMKRHATATVDWLGEERARRLEVAFETLSRAVTVSWNEWRRVHEFQGAGELGPFGSWPSFLDSLDAEENADAATAALAEERPARFYRALASPAGLEGRAWYKNRLWTPGLETGYSSETFPTLRPAATSGDDATLDRELDDLVAAIDALRVRWDGRAQALRER